MTDYKTSYDIRDALGALKNNQRQLDFDGCEVGVSRQALCEVVEWAEEALSVPQPAAASDSDDPFITIREKRQSYEQGVTAGLFLKAAENARGKRNKEELTGQADHTRSLHEDRIQEIWEQYTALKNQQSGKL